MKPNEIVLGAMLWALLLGTTGCSQGADSRSPQAEMVVQHNAAADAIRGNLQSPIRKARSTQYLGDERLDAMDQAIRVNK